MLTKLMNEINHFKKQTHDFKTLVITNLVFAFTLPVIEIFIAAFVMRQSNDPAKVILYQFTVYTGIPIAFFFNGFLLRVFNIRGLFSAGMLLSGVSMVIMMSLHELTNTGIGTAGIIMGFAFGFYWANRDYLALAITNDDNRNYYYGLETFFYTIIAVIVPISIGWIIESNAEIDKHGAYRTISFAVIAVTIIASIICFTGRFANPPKEKFIYRKFNPLWYKLLILALLKGLSQGFIVTAPAMLIMKLLGKEGALGTAQSVGAIIAAFMIYLVGRLSAPKHRIKIFTLGLVLFAAGAFFNCIMFDKTGVVIFVLLLLVARPLMDVAYFPIQFRVIDVVSKIENRTEFAYILNHEFGLYAGRFLGATTFLLLAYNISDNIALRYAILIIAVIQLLSIVVGKNIIAACNKISSTSEITKEENKEAEVALTVVEEKQ
ncbi:MFS transporter [Ferruginibacter albus]|uniref:MFS transporter n=1 Tax=Ferruginibacter albus TaxID=2875540 RepID=UPI001CC3C751|nr:MFS transporter [Ferruginibacter albus]UAY53607.1 MFS transporter [Ferruginibacter albus]